MMKTRTIYAGCFTFILACMAIPCQSSNAETFDVTLEGIDFVYDGMANLDIDLTIQQGDTIRWTWVSGNHNIASGFPAEPNGGSLFFSGAPTNVPGTAFEYTFDDIGLFGYHCEVHELIGMVSSVTVVPEPARYIGLLALAGFFVASRRVRKVAGPACE